MSFIEAQCLKYKLFQLKAMGLDNADLNENKWNKHKIEANLCYRISF